MSNQLSCEQVYNIWISEPELIQLLDLRPLHEYQTAHIPGAAFCTPADLVEKCRTENEKLAVLIAPKEIQAELTHLLAKVENYVFMNECQRWFELKHPITGLALKNRILQGPYSEFQKGSMTKMQKNEIIFQQLFEPESSTYTYIIADAQTKEAAIIDPVLETVDRDLKLINELGLKLVYALDTHIHADHVTGAGEIRKRTGIKTGVSQDAEVACVDIPLDDGQELLLGNRKIKCVATPGHTNTCMSFLFEGMVFTGDALLIRGCGRTDFQQGDSEKLFQSVREKLFSLPDQTIVYPGHDYRGLTSSTIGTEKAHNARLNERVSKEEFKKIMSELKLAHPKKIHEAVPANLACGRAMDSKVLHPQSVDGVPEITSEDLKLHLSDVKNGKVQLVDVRRPDEFNNELGHIQGAILKTLGPELEDFLKTANREQEIVFICRSGGRSGSATVQSLELGFKKTVNLAGGMIRWNELGYEVARK